MSQLRILYSRMSDIKKGKFTKISKLNILDSDFSNICFPLHDAHLLNGSRSKDILFSVIKKYKKVLDKVRAEHMVAVVRPDQLPTNPKTTDDNKYSNIKQNATVKDNKSIRGDKSTRSFGPRMGDSEGPQKIGMNLIEKLTSINTAQPLVSFDLDNTSNNWQDFFDFNPE